MYLLYALYFFFHLYDLAILKEMEVKRKKYLNIKLMVFFFGVFLNFIFRYVALLQPHLTKYPKQITHTPNKRTNKQTSRKTKQSTFQINLLILNI